MPFGRVLRGEIHIRAPLIWIAWQRPAEPTTYIWRWASSSRGKDDPQNRSNPVSCGLPPQRGLQITLHFDDEKTAMEDPEGFFGLVLERRGSAAEGLLVRSSKGGDDSEYFSRLGTFEMKAKRLALGATRKICRRLVII